MTFEQCRGLCHQNKETPSSKFTPYDDGWRHCLVCRYATKTTEPPRCYCCNCRYRYKVRQKHKQFLKSFNVKAKARYISR